PARDGEKEGFVVVDMPDVDRFAPIEGVTLPDGPLSLVVGLDRGDDMANWSPDEALPEITGRGRTPLLLHEGIHWALQVPEVVARNHCYMTIGSRLRTSDGRLDTRTPAIWISNGTGRDGRERRGAPKVGWCWAGNRHTWLGFASAAGRLPAGGPPPDGGEPRPRGSGAALARVSSRRPGGVARVAASAEEAQERDEDHRDAEHDDEERPVRRLARGEPAEARPDRGGDADDGGRARDERSPAARARVGELPREPAGEQRAPQRARDETEPGEDERGAPVGRVARDARAQPRDRGACRRHADEDEERREREPRGRRARDDHVEDLDAEHRRRGDDEAGEKDRHPRREVRRGCRFTGAARHRQSLLCRIANRRRNSRYSQTSVTRRPNAADHANLAGTPPSTPRLIESKSTMSEAAARPTATRLITMPSVPPRRPQPSRTPKRIRPTLTRENAR